MQFDTTYPSDPLTTNEIIGGWIFLLFIVILIVFRSVPAVRKVGNVVVVFFAVLGLTVWWNERKKK